MGINLVVVDDIEKSITYYKYTHAHLIITTLTTGINKFYHVSVLSLFTHHGDHL